jgi:hypothetical protein
MRSLSDGVTGMAGDLGEEDPDDVVEVELDSDDTDWVNSTTGCETAGGGGAAAATTTAGTGAAVGATWAARSACWTFACYNRL